jgi:hypothetical protein
VFITGGSLVIAIKPKAKENSHQFAPVLSGGTRSLMNVIDTDNMAEQFSSHADC